MSWWQRLWRRLRRPQRDLYPCKCPRCMAGPESNWWL